MPATKKKSASKLKFANVTKRKKVLLISVFALVVLGAGIIIRSFAASVLRTWTADEYFGIYATGYGSVTKVQDTVTQGKAPVNVWKVGPRGAISATTLSITIAANTTYQYCVTAKGAGSLALANSRWTVGVASAAYNSVCAPITSTGQYALAAGPISIYNSSASADIYIQNVYLQLASNTGAATK